ncbi:polysaccharide deacetylase family protein [Halobacteria archaeon AArc-dxtr1]|nr:polysaccharide deacetylase family protein [Halobacteria archaeon AArc-dxtr1]
MGRVVLSLDAELGWGFHDLASPPPARVEAGRRGWRTMLDLLEETRIPATWAVVGHLLLDACDGRHDAHPTPEGWFERERGAWKDRPDLRFGTDLVAELLESPVDHEFASHSFSHVLFGNPATTREIADTELERSVAAADDWGQRIDSFIYPRNDVGHRDVLAEHGVSAYRGRSPTPDGARGIVRALRGGSLLVEPTVDEYGLVNVPASMFLFGCEGPVRSVAESVWDDPMVALARRGIDEAAEADDDAVFHMWLHPNNLVTERDDHRMRTILEYLNQRRRDGSVTVETMRSIAEGARPCSVRNAKPAQTR